MADEACSEIDNLCWIVAIGRGTAEIRMNMVEAIGIGRLSSLEAWIGN